MKSLPFFLMTILSLLLATCANTRTSTPHEQEFNLGDGGLISGEPCGPPCFLNITPGISSPEETKRNLEDQIGYATCAWDNTNDASGVNCGNFVIYFNKTSIVETISYHPSTTVTIEEVINKYQEPDSWGVAVMDENTRPYIIWLELDYHEYRMTIILESQVRSERIYPVVPSARVASVIYYDDAAYRLDNIYIPWQGYGDYKGP